VSEQLDKIGDDIHDIKTTLSGQAIQLADHIRRTQLLEEAVIPIKQHVARMEGAAKLLGVISLVAIVATGVVDVVKMMVAHVGH